MFYNGNDESDSDGDDDEGDNACVQYFRVQESDPNTTHRVPEHPLLPFLNLASQPTPVPGEDNNENDDKVETIKEASKENTCNIILHDDVTCIFFYFHRLHFNFISTSNFQSYGRPRNARPGRVGDGEGIQCFPFLARKRNLSIFLPYMQKTCDVAVKAILPKKNCGKIA